MGVARNILLWSSRNQKLRELLPRYRFIRKSVNRFMPGEEISDALNAAEVLKNRGIPTVVTHLGENVQHENETAAVRDHYLDVLDQIQARRIDMHISVKLTELGLDQNQELCYSNLKSLIEKARRVNNFVWIDMEGSKYTESTLATYHRVRSENSNVGLCLQSYLYRTSADLEKLIPLSPAIRLVKGAYAEPSDIAIPDKKQNDENYFRLATTLLGKVTTSAIATHDLDLLRRIQKQADTMNLPKDAYEIQMLYGIRSETQEQLVREGFRVRVLISYGRYWFPWYMRRLAERPANVWFVVRNLFAK